VNETPCSIVDTNVSGEGAASLSSTEDEGSKVSPLGETLLQMFTFVFSIKLHGVTFQKTDLLVVTVVITPVYVSPYVRFP
jgi:hypothetical protein